MRYKAYIIKIDTSKEKWSPGEKLDTTDVNSPIDEDDDLSKLQSRIRDKGVEFIKRVRVIDTYYEYKFNKIQDELKLKNEKNIGGHIEEIFAKYMLEPITNQLIAKIKLEIYIRTGISPKSIKQSGRTLCIEFDNLQPITINIKGYKE